ncbi:hypothetical protein ACGFZA_40135 [Streptomyces sp. NPDC048211]|uniref:hypothetical protein n=1 Tax=Streptomyces sp. NPDC048211 TaxID=3365516 RepID=UPI003717C247
MRSTLWQSTVRREAAGRAATRARCWPNSRRTADAAYAELAELVHGMRSLRSTIPSTPTPLAQPLHRRPAQ